MKTFLYYLNDYNYHPEISAIVLNSTKDSPEDMEILAVRLKRIFEGKGLNIELETIPNLTNYIDSVTGKNKFILFPELSGIYLEKYGNRWLFSRESVEIINSLYNETFAFDTYTFTDELKGFWKYSFLGIYVWQVTGFLICLLICIIFYFVFNWIFGYFLEKIYSKLFSHKLYLKYIIPVSKPLSIFLVIWVFGEIILLLHLPVKAAYFMGMAVKASQPVLITIIVFKLCDLAIDIFALFAAKTSSTVDDQLVPFMRKVIKVAVVVIGFIYLFNNLGIDITPLIAGVSIGGLAFALAAQDTIKNLFGSMTILTDQPFQTGDWIVFDSVEGSVEEVGIRSTRIRTFYNSQISVPNGKLADIKIDNMGRRQFRRYVTNLSITYDTPPDLIDEFVLGLRKIVDNHPNTRKDYYQIYLNDLADSSIKILFYIFFEAPDWPIELESRHEIISEILKLAAELKVKFAFPTQTVHIKDFPILRNEQVVEKANNLES